MTLVEKIRKIQADIRAHETAAERLRAELGEARKELLVGTETQTLRSIAPKASTAERRRPIREDSSVGWAVKILREHQRALDADRLVALVNERGHMNVSKATLVSSLARYTRAGDTFTRPRPGIYGLREFQEASLLETA